MKKIYFFTLTLVLSLGLLYYVLPESHPQSAKAETYVNTPGGRNTDSCNRVRVTVSENPSCPRLTEDAGNSCNIISGAKNNVSSYTMRLNVSSNDGQAHNITYLGATNFCPGGYLQGSQTYCGCVNNEQKGSYGAKNNNI